ncbi:aminodeoxychorismate lyase [Parendozoicomonas sp. Alg238-R29]|uniref:aminodeoxychorismate lyase n=1 Tax=Parendozoicomonas sp. Alg238-R29 TaxID=2993446 RepID=UPI00248DC5FB|nr:aminodeoxychorismate lyase [Parendozoicomonas sp. Alg238-R29]
MSEEVFPRFWVDGEQAVSVPVADRGFQYGDGVFETIRIAGGRLPLEKWHYRRLQRSCDRLHLPLNLDHIAQQVSNVLRDCGDGVLKVMVTRGSGGRGYSPANASGRVVLGWFPSSDVPVSWIEEGIRVKVCETRLGHTPVLAGLKHMNRLEQVLARGEWRGSEFQEGVVSDIAGNLVEGTMSNVFLVVSDEILTPDLSLCGVEGVCRQWLLEASRKSFSVRVCHLALDDLLAADEVFFANSVIGVLPVRECGDRYWEPGSVSRDIQKELAELFV